MFKYVPHSDLYFIKNNKKQLYLKIFIIYNIAVFIYCLLTEQEFIFAFTIAQVTVGVISILPVYLLPMSDLFDFYYKRRECMMVYRGVTLFISMQLLTIFLSEYFSSYVMDIIYILFLKWMIYLRTIHPSYAEYNIQQRFKQIIQQRNVEILWSDYIRSNVTNYNHFMRFLATNNCLEDMLFVLDVITYKNRLRQLFLENMIELKIGFTLSFDINDHLPTSPIVAEMEEKLRDIQNEKIRNRFVYYSFVDLFEKYVDSDGRRMNASSISYKHSLDMKNKINAMKIENIPNYLDKVIVIFDDALIETNTMLQFIYREYHLQSNSLS